MPITNPPITVFAGRDIAGPTTARPANADNGLFFFDTTLNQWIVWNGTTWQTAGQVTLAASALTAFAGGGQAGAKLLVTGQNEFTTVANDHDSAILPASVPGTVVIVNNFGGHILDIYANGSDTINAIAALSPFSVNNAKTVILNCPKAGQWYTTLTA